MTDQDTNQPILCSACKARSEIRMQPDGSGVVACTSCAATEDYEVVKRDLLEQMKEYASERLRRSFGKSGNWQYTKGVRPQSVHRFFVDFESSHGGSDE